MKDLTLRGTALGGQVRFFVGNTRELVEVARVSHDLMPLATAALGRTLTAASMMGMTLKGEDQLTVAFNGNGVLGKVVARATSQGEVKGYVDHPEADLPLKSNGKINVSDGIGFGMLSVTKDMGLKEPYVGTVPIVSGEIGEDLTEYYYSSEQTLSAVGLGVLVDVDYSVKAAGGFILQLMPDAQEGLGEQLDERVQKLPPLSSYLHEHTLEELLEELFGNDYVIHEKQEPRFLCHCSKENFATALLTLSTKDLEDLSMDPEIEVVCQFCSTTYVFGAEEVKELVAAGQNNR